MAHIIYYITEILDISADGVQTNSAAVLCCMAHLAVGACHASTGNAILVVKS